MKEFNQISLLIGIFANLYLGVLGMFQFDFLKYLFKTNETLLHFTYLLFGICGIINLLLLKKE